MTITEAEDLVDVVTAVVERSGLFSHDEINAAKEVLAKAKEHFAPKEPEEATGQDTPPIPANYFGTTQTAQ